MRGLRTAGLGRCDGAAGDAALSIIAIVSEAIGSGAEGAGAALDRWSARRRVALSRDAAATSELGERHRAQPIVSTS